MIRRRWRQDLGWGRMVALALGGIAVGAAVVTLAAAAGRHPEEALPLLGIGTLAFGVRAWHDEHVAGINRAAARAMRRSAGVAACLVLAVSVAAVLGPGLHGNPAVRAAWPATSSTALGLTAIASVLWERDLEQRRWLAESWVSLGVAVIGCFVVLAGPGRVEALGLVAAGAGFVALVTLGRRVLTSTERGAAPA